jgi:hypothetical protein
LDISERKWGKVENSDPEVAKIRKLQAEVEEYVFEREVKWESKGGVGPFAYVDGVPVRAWSSLVGASELMKELTDRGLRVSIRAPGWEGEPFNVEIGGDGYSVERNGKTLGEALCQAAVDFYKTKEAEQRISPLSVWAEDLKLATENALEIGESLHGDLWKKGLEWNNKDHVMEHMMKHIEAKMLAGFVEADYKRLDKAVARWGEAVGYVAVMIAKLRWLEAKGSFEDDE